MNTRILMNNQWLGKGVVVTGAEDKERTRGFFGVPDLGCAPFAVVGEAAGVEGRECMEVGGVDDRPGGVEEMGGVEERGGVDPREGVGEVGESADDGVRGGCWRDAVGVRLPERISMRRVKSSVRNS